MRAASHRSTLVGAMLLAMSLSAVAVAGCSASPKPLPSTSSTPSATPVFASDEEALAAAEEAYAAYLRVDNAVGQSGGKGESLYSTVAAGEALTNALANAKQFRDAKAHTIGQAAFTVRDLQSAEYEDPRNLSISFYICDDLSEVELVGEDGKTMSESEINDSAPFLVTVVSSTTSNLLVSNIALWDGDDYCA
ncbi:hypothetical protein WJX64_02560 [Leifsonia sp. YIM 134122]|uniref:Secreted protein n=1 Tax=Leifsonia stereocauli TaxID=3134136 RepID=A0ABU9W0B4_9MICO